MKVSNNSLAAMEDYFHSQCKNLYSPPALKIIWSTMLNSFLKGKSTLLLSESEILLFLKAIKNLKNGVPYQYVCKNAAFYGLELEVNPSTLIPRPETEELVEWILNSEKDECIKLKDICTGSGCIALALKKNREKWEIYGTDYFDETLKTAQENGKKLNLSIHWLKENALEWQNTASGILDIIVSNPPYISEKEKEEMAKNVVDFEPHEALFAPGTDALIFYRKIAKQAMHDLKKGGRIYLELNQYLAEEIKEILTNAGFENVEIKVDMSGNKRMLRAIK